jgi:Amt family ammonium transporter
MCSINLSGSSLGDTDFLEFIIDGLSRYKIPPQKICFEITETMAVQTFNNTVIFMEKLKKLGCKFALDDFGSGFSSYAYLKNLPVDYLKIDGAFVRDIAEDKLDRSMVKSINEIAHVMGKKTIAEYVENPEILSFLYEIEVDYAQGFYIGKPEPLDNILLNMERKQG